MAGKGQQADGLLAPFLPVLIVGLTAVAMRLRREGATAAMPASIETKTLRAEASRAPAPAFGDGIGGRARRLKAIGITVYNGINQHRVLAIAAGVTFYALLALFPAIAALVSLYGFFANPSTISADLQQLAGVLPEGAIDIIKDQLTRVSLQQQGTLGLTFIVSLAISLWSANSGIKALMDALNVVRGEEEKRNFFYLNAISLLFTTAAIFFIILALLAVVVVPVVVHYIGFDQLAPKLVSILRWPGLLVATALGLAALYRYGPCCSRPRWRWLSVGSVLAALLWIAASYLFSWYTAHFGSYNKTYGSLGAVVGFMTWIWISVIVILLGAELDMAIAATSRKTQLERKRAG